MTKKVILITGGAGRIGSTLAKAIVSLGASVAIVDVNKKKLKKLEKELGKKNCFIVISDASSKKGSKLCISKAFDYFGRIDAAVHAAYPRSARWGTRFEDLDNFFLGQDLTRQLGGAILFSQQILSFFKKQGYGNLIHISSIQGVAAPKFEHYKNTSMVTPIEYSAIKAGIIAITKYLAKYYKNKKIRVNCISPGGILDRQPTNFINRYKKSCTSKGMLEADDLIGTLLFLISNDSKYINGQNIIVDDGWTL